jgi:DNA replication and repair protein RecF
MVLKRLSLSRFRNLTDVEISFDSKRCFIFGDNAQGKTNILESIYLLCLAKSFRTNDDEELVSFEERGLLIHGEFINDTGNSKKVSVQYDAGTGKAIRVDGKNVRPFSQLIGQFPVVALSSENYSITQGPPAYRRKFFDILISQSSARYLEGLKEYDRILKQRNKILSDFAQKKISRKNEMDVWNKQLIEKGDFIIRCRSKVIEEINSSLSTYYQKITNKKDVFQIKYSPHIQFQSFDHIKATFVNQLTKLEAKELLLGKTLVGPQRDEYLFMIDGKNIRLYGSRGEHKSALISLKAAESILLKKKTGTEPILLLDDLYAELDKKRGQNVLNLFSNESQCIITGTSSDYDVLSETQRTQADFSTYFVKEGKVERLQDAKNSH